MDSEKEIEENESKLKKFYIVLMSFLIVVLALSYFLLGPRIFEIVGSLTESSELKNNLTIETKNLTIVLEKNVYKSLKDIYFENHDREFKACLLGNIKNGTYYVSEIYIPKQKGEFNKVVYTSCPKETIISLHSHPFLRCIPSKQDFLSFSNFKKINPNVLMMIMCSEDRFYVYGN